MISYFMLRHIGSSEGITLLEFNKEEEEDQQETPQTATPGEEEQTPEDLFPQRQASKHSKSPMFYKISLEPFMFDALGYKS